MLVLYVSWWVFALSTGGLVRDVKPSNCLLSDDEETLKLACVPVVAFGSRWVGCGG